jgi:tetratricopeptide (TPR) repeat protein
VLYQDQDKYSEAIAEFNETLKLRPDYNKAHYHLVLLYGRTHQKELAAQQLAILKQIKKEDSDADALDGKNESTRQATGSQKVN